MKDQNYQLPIYRSSRLEHRYPDQIKLIHSPVAQTLLAKLSSPQSKGLVLSTLVQSLYQILFNEVMNDLAPKEEVKWPTRMMNLHPEGVFEGQVIEQQRPVVVVDLARAGTIPSQACYLWLNLLIDGEQVRQDHFYINRKTNPQGEVIGVDVSGSKIGGGQDKAIVLFPDPMGATGGSLSHCVNHYKEKVEGKAFKYVAMHLIITPEYIKHMSETHPEVEVYALRLDRGLSNKQVLESIPGEFWPLEKGLNDHQYIVPGAGGVGEILNNSFV